MSITKLPDWSTPDQQDVADIRQTVEDYFLGWFDGDSDRMRRALHPELVKRSYRPRNGEQPSLSSMNTAAQMIDSTAAGHGRQADPAKRQLEINVDDVHGSIATARVNSAPYREYLHLARTPAGWRIVHALWTWTDLSRVDD